ncbi:hypothetical protein [uncultured Thiodictyon sp.]|uniref:hypothetical protein n=1 Tax=uncultured Thiodictyon sp. TaxID=1846217 RepID=UPI0025DFA642|nr:hypothetical protein [uncultured Thiodictyon sp.]
MLRKASLLSADPILFSPIYLDADNVSTEKLLALYRFANLFFPKMGSSLVKTIMDMERHGERLTANSSPHERRKLISQMESLSMDIQFKVCDGGQNVMEISIHIVPSEVLERAQQGGNSLTQYRELKDDLDKLIIKLIAKELSRRFTAKIAEGIKALTGIKQVPSFITQLLEMGWINGNGQLLQGASIDDLLTGKYRDQFEQLMPKELVQEGMQIRDTIETFFAISQDDTDSLIADARRRHALLEITLRETKMAF